MKKIYSPVIGLIFFALMMSAMISCKKGGFLAPTTTTNLNETTVFADSANAVRFLAGIYTNIGFSFKPDRFVYDPGGKGIPVGGLEAACDEAEPANQFASTALAFATGTINASVVTDDAYKKSYEGIRAANQLIKNIDKIPLKEESFRNQMKAEARFLRAWYYAILLKHYGGIPLMGDDVFDYKDNITNKRNTYEECVNYIVSECDAVFRLLPITQTGQQYGRASGGACAALKARVLLYAASPLFNGVDASYASGELASIVGYPTANPARWAAARDAAKAIIDGNVYELNLSNGNKTAKGPGAGFRYLWPQRVNKEYIFPFMTPTSNTYLEDLFLPPSRTGSNGSRPYQGLVDAFPMKNGLPITDAASGFNPNNPYANRDPRMEYTVFHDQSLLCVRTGNGAANAPTPIDIFVGPTGLGGEDSYPDGTNTGYYTNKMIDSGALANAVFARTNRVLPLIRYAEVLLNFAEAQNEVAGPGGSTDIGPTTVYGVLKMIRSRAGIIPGADNLYGLGAGLSKEQMRAVIQNERRIELAFEEHRFWDVRRWKIAPQTDNLTAQGMKVVRNGATVTYTKVNVKRHNFRPAMYLWPLPQNEIAKSNTLLQNPGY
jgi:hypothetical protein